MGKEFTVQLGGRERALRYTFADARAIHRRFGPLPKLVAEDQLGMFSSTNVNPDLQVALIGYGVAHDLRIPLEEAEKRVEGWFDELMAEPGGKGIGPAIVAAFRAALYAGIVHGRSVDWDAELEKYADLRKALDASEAVGKGEETPQEPPPAA